MSAGKPGGPFAVAVKRLRERGLQGHDEWLVCFYVSLSLCLSLSVRLSLSEIYVVPAERIKILGQIESSKYSEAHRVLLGA